MELGTERPVGMGLGQIPISKIWQYIDRFDLPDHWEPILLQADAAIVASLNKEADKDGGRPTNTAPDKAVQQKQRTGLGAGGGGVRSA